MPKKTKKEKLLAQAHRHPTYRRPSTITRSVDPVENPIVTSQITYTVPHAHASAKAATINVEHTAIKRDLGKTIIWSTLIIIGELLLSRYLK